MLDPGGDELAAARRLLWALDAGDRAAGLAWLETLLLATGRVRTAWVVRQWAGNGGNDMPTADPPGSGPDVVGLIFGGDWPLAADESHPRPGPAAPLLPLYAVAKAAGWPLGREAADIPHEVGPG